MDSTDPAKYKRLLELFARMNDAVRDHLQRISVAIVCFKDGIPAAVGSGTCIRVGERYLVATAAHVVKTYPDDQLFLVPQREKQTWTPLVVGRGLSDDLHDVAWLEIDTRIAPELAREFVDIRRLQPGIAHRENDLVVVHGFPTRLVDVRESEGGIGVRPLCFASLTLDESSRPTQTTCSGSPEPTPTDSTRDLFVAYPDEELVDKDGLPIEAIEAPGLSGGGIWAINANTSDVWSPENCKLVGIEHCWRRWEFLMGTQIQHWLRLIIDQLPDLAPVVRDAFPEIDASP